MKKLTALVCSLIVSSYACATMQLDMQARYENQVFSAAAVVENGAASCLLGVLRVDASVEEVDGKIAITARLFQVQENGDAIFLGETPAKLETTVEQTTGFQLNTENGDEVLAVNITPHVVAE